MSIETPQGKDINLRFEVVEKTEDMLRVRYEAENVSSSDLYLFNHLYHDYNEEGIFELDANLVYVSVEGSTARLLKGIPDIPYGILAEIPIVPCATLLPRGQRSAEILQIGLPLRQFNPYTPDERPVIENLKEIIFSLGYFPVAEIGQRPVNNVRTTEGQALYAYVTPWDQLVVSTPPVALAEGDRRTQAQKTCPNCGAIQPPESRFCSQCGSPL
jgi:ribosomal protein L40E